MVFSHSCSEGQLDGSQHLTIFASCVAPSLYTSSAPRIWVAPWSVCCWARTLIVGPSAAPAASSWDPHLCVCLSLFGATRARPDVFGNLSRSHQTLRLCCSSPRLWSPRTGYSKDWANPQATAWNHHSCCYVWASVSCLTFTFSRLL